MGECFLPLAHDLGYRASFFNLVFVTNKVTVISSISLLSTWMSNEQKFPHLDKNVLKTYQLRESLIPPINWGSTQETDQLNILSEQHFCQMGLELRPNSKLPMHTLICFYFVLKVSDRLWKELGFTLVSLFRFSRILKLTGQIPSQFFSIFLIWQIWLAKVGTLPGAARQEGFGMVSSFWSIFVNFQNSSLSCWGVISSNPLDVYW